MTGTQVAQVLLHFTPTTAQMVALMKAMQAEDPKSFDFRVKFDSTTPKYGRQQDGNTPLQLAETIRQALGGGCELDEILHNASMITLGSESASRGEDLL
jgi:hypothetical protein